MALLKLPHRLIETYHLGQNIPSYQKTFIVYCYDFKQHIQHIPNFVSLKI